MSKIPHNERIAKATPIGLLFSSAYHLGNQFKLLFFVGMSILFLLLSAFYFFPYSIQEVVAIITTFNRDIINILLYGIIYIVAFIGLWKIVKIMAATEIELSIAKIVGLKAEEKIQEHRTEIPINEFIGIIKIVVNKNYNSSILRLFNLIADEARDKKFVSSTILMEPYKDESNGEIMKVSLFQRMVLQLGILGTFIGLIIAFGNMDLERLNDGLKIISSSLKYAFSTSIAGLMSSIILGILVFVLRRKQEDYFKAMETTTTNLTSLARKTISEGALLNGLHEATKAFHQNSNKINALKFEVNEQTKAMTQGMTALANSKQDFNAFTKELKDMEIAFISEMRNIYQTLSPNQMSTELKSALEKASMSYLVTTQKKYNELNALIDKSNQNIKAIEKHLSHNANLFKSNNQNQKEFIAQLTESHVSGQIIKAMKKSAEEMGQHTNQQIKLFNDRLGNFSEQLNIFNDNTGSYLKKKHRIEKGILLTLMGLMIVGFVYLNKAQLHTLIQSFSQ